MANDVDLEEIAKATAGYSGADLENLMNESAIFAARRNHLEITRKDIEDANKVMMGTENVRELLPKKKRNLRHFTRQAMQFWQNLSIKHRIFIRCQ